MRVEHHDLHHEFPEYDEAIHQLKMNDAHFARLFDEYHTLDRQIRKIEEGGDLDGGGFLNTLKQQRVALKDTLEHMLKQA